MATLTAVEFQNYRSVEGLLRLEIPRNRPAVLFGENNVGKSNLVRGVEMILGHYWPGNREPDDHEFFGREPDRTIRIECEFARGDLLGRDYEYVIWEHDPREPVDDRTSLWGQRPNGTRGGISNDDRDECYCVAAHAEDDLSYQLSYRSKATLLSKIMRRFHSDLVEHQDVKQRLEALFGETKEQFYRIPSFSAFSESLRRQLGDFLGSMTHQLDVDFEAYNPVNFFQALRLQPVEDEGARALDELGTGEQQVLAISLAYAYAQGFHTGIILILEEPEAHLHPLAQQWLSKRLIALAEGGVQLIMTTHSPHFIDVMNLEGLTRVQKIDGSTSVIQRSITDLVQHNVDSGVPANQVDEENVLPFYRSHATTDLLEGLFATVVVLVEGPTESLALPIYLERAGLSTARQGVAVIPVHGKGNLAKWRRLFTLFEIPTYVVFDNDPGDDREGNKRRDALASVGIEAHESEGYIDTEDWLVEPAFCVFGTDFEETLRAHFDGYADGEDEAVNTHGINTKPFKARWVAENLDVEADEPGAERLLELTRALEQLVARASPGRGREETNDALGEDEGHPPDFLRDEGLGDGPEADRADAPDAGENDELPF